MGDKNIIICTLASTFHGTAETVVIIFLADFLVDDLRGFFWFKDIVIRNSIVQSWLEDFLGFLGQWDNMRLSSMDGTTVTSFLSY